MVGQILTLVGQDLGASPSVAVGAYPAGTC